MEAAGDGDNASVASLDDVGSMGSLESVVLPRDVSSALNSCYGKSSLGEVDSSYGGNVEWGQCELSVYLCAVRDSADVVEPFGGIRFYGGFQFFEFAARADHHVAQGVHAGGG